MYMMYSGENTFGAQQLGEVLEELCGGAVEE